MPAEELGMQPLREAEVGGNDFGSPLGKLGSVVFQQETIHGFCFVFC